MSPPRRRPDSPTPIWPRFRLLLWLLFIVVGVADGVPRPPLDTIESEGAIEGERPPAGDDALGPGAPEGTEDDEAIRVAPQYMLELYRKFSNDKYSHPIANIVRSFKNINTGSPVVWSNGTELHSLQFNISSFGDGEEIFLAELRLFASAETRGVSVYEVAKAPLLPSATDTDETGSQSPLRYRLLGSRDRVPSAQGGSWETFPVTDVVRRWANTRETAGHVLEVRVDIAAAVVGGPQKEDVGGGGGEGVADGGDGGFGTGGYEPIIVVFSNDRKRRKIELRELHEIESRENEAREEDDEEEEEEEAETRRKKSRNKNDHFPHSQSSSSSTSSSSSSAKEEDDEEDEEDDYDSDPDPSRNQRNSTHEASSAASAAAWSNHSRPKSLSSDPRRRSTRVKRTLPSRGRHRRGERRNSCRRKPMYVDFRDVKWENWIIQPPGYQAYECTGQCYFPLQQRLTPTKYALVKSLLHATYPKKASAVCCVPTRLEPISLLYLDEDDIVTYKYEYDDMVVAECGCR